MSDDSDTIAAVLRSMQVQASTGAVRITLHASAEMVEEGISLDDVLEAISSDDAMIVENYPEHRRGACCLVMGTTRRARPLHVVCTSAQPVLIVITAYEPKPPKWITPTTRSSR